MKNYFIDTHAHLTDERLFPILNEILKDANKQNVKKIICASFNLETSEKAKDIAELYDNVYFTMGVHPSDCEFYNEIFEQAVKDNAHNPKFVAIGEIGLDYHFEPFDKEKQKQIFKKQIKLANLVGMPIVIHSRDATKDMLEILKQNEKLIKNGCLIHCFSGSVETMRELFKMGYYIALGGAITFKNSNNATKIIENLDMEKFVLETDCPYLAPEPMRGKLNKPENVVKVAEKIEEIKNIGLEDVANFSTANAKKIFVKIK